MGIFTCCLDPRTGRLPHSEQPSFIFRVQAGDTVQFQLDSASDLNTHSTSLLIDLSKYDDCPQLTSVPGSHSAMQHWQAAVTFPRAGSYTLQLQYEDPLTGEVRLSQEDFIVVEPRVQIAGRKMTLDSLVVQTVLSRSMGPYTRWKEVITRQKDLGYNMIHFTPIQELGVSQSLYSLGDQLKLNSSLFPGLFTASEQMEALEATIREVDSLGVGCCIDIVLNHMSISADFIETCPQAGYNLENSPYLRVAYELDRALALFSTDLANDRVARYKHGHVIDCERDVGNVMQVIKLELLPKLKLQEFFLMDQTQVLHDLQTTESLPRSCVSSDWTKCVQTNGLAVFIQQHALLRQGEGRKVATVRTK